ncbi:hypothetical protein B0H17DRAFT_1147780 [Mycena rosella]|uniref:Uncharacterized protein n=1 Tax=Mycena rosella TaxID=1033263 RepID=A0AAD7CHN1_MYCRO|nr:hypothetical protein B0H17DRAFT_1147780 [Mycena rosella]
MRGGGLIWRLIHGQPVRVGTTIADLWALASTEIPVHGVEAQSRLPRDGRPARCQSSSPFIHFRRVNNMIIGDTTRCEATIRKSDQELSWNQCATRLDSTDRVDQLDDRAEFDTDLGLQFGGPTNHAQGGENLTEMLYSNDWYGANRYDNPTSSHGYNPDAYLSQQYTSSQQYGGNIGNQNINHSAATFNSPQNGLPMDDCAARDLLAQLRTNYPTIFDRTPASSSMYSDPETIKQVQALATANTKKVLPDVVPGFKASTLDIVCGYSQVAARVSVT